MTKVHVLAGGSSPEREVSLRSGAGVAAALQSAGYEVETVDPATANIYQIANCAVIFPAMHGCGAEDGVLQAELEKYHAKYVGTGPEASSLCFNKDQYREFAATNSLPIAEGAVVTLETYRSHPLLRTPFVLKPVDGGSSIDTYIVRDVAAAPYAAIEETLTRQKRMLAEQLISGIELTVGILGTQPLPVTEIVPPAGAEFDYQNKYNGTTQELCPPQHLNQIVQKEAQQLALRVHKLCGCRDLSRTDMIYETNSGKLYLLETNTLPGMTPQSLYPKMSAAAGLTMPQLCHQLVQFALNR